MELRVIRYNSVANYHLCRGLDGKEHRVDLFVDGPIEGHDDKSIVGHSVSVDYLSPFIEIASNVKVINPRKDGRE